jgi:hypothetical protein
MQEVYLIFTKVPINRTGFVSFQLNDFFNILNTKRNDKLVGNNG